MSGVSTSSDTVKSGWPAAVAILTGARHEPAAAYVTLCTETGFGASRVGETALTTWEGSLASGLCFHLRDLDQRRTWLLAGSPAGEETNAETGGRARWRPGVFSQQFRCDEISIVIEACVLADAPGELRRLTVSNRSDRPRRLDLTSVAEVVLNQAPAHTGHPGFSKLFLQTSYDEDRRALLVSRRPRAPHDRFPTLIHAVLDPGPVEYETDRAAFFGRGGRQDRPDAQRSTAPLSGTVGNVLDPVVSLRRGFALAPGQSATVTFLLGAFATADAALDLAGTLAQDADIIAAFTTAQTEADKQLARLGVSAEDHRHAQHLAAAILRRSTCLRAPAQRLTRAAGDPSDLRRYGIDPMRPLAVAAADCAGADGLLTAARVWSSLHLPIQTVILESGDRNKISPAATATADSGAAVLHLSADELDPAAVDLLAVAADFWLDEVWPELATLMSSSRSMVATSVDDATACSAPDEGATTDLQFGNGYGGFSADGREYILRLGGGDTTAGLRLPPQPWTNVLANERLGCVVSETGAGVVWGANSREHRLTPWSNDPLLDPHGEALYLCDLDGPAQFSCMPGPRPAGGAYEVAHGHGYTRFRRQGDELAIDTLVFIDRVAPIRLTRLRITNQADRTRRLALLNYAQLVLGGVPAESSRFVQTERDAATCALLARNPQAGIFAGYTTFAAMVGDAHLGEVSGSGDRVSVLGPELDPSRPAALSASALDGRFGAGLDPCFAQRAELELPAGETAEVWLLLGQEMSREDAVARLAVLRTPDACQAAWSATRDFWRQALEGLRIKTPSPGLDVMVNGWLGYQTLACRMWGRSALYQSGGAYGFPRPAPGFPGLAVPVARSDAAPDPAARRAPVRRGRCAALVAPAVEPRHPHALRRRSLLATVLRGGLHPGHG